MVYLILTVTALFLAGQNVVKQKYNETCTSGIYFFSGSIPLFAMLFFIVINRNWEYDVCLLLPSVAFAVGYSMATAFTVLAMKYGSIAKTSLINSYSLLIPTFYGILVLKEPVGVTLIIGVVLLVLSLWLTNSQKTKERGSRVSWKWVLFVFLSFLGNGLCSTVQKATQTVYETMNTNLFMIVALAICAVTMFLLSFLSKEVGFRTETVKKGVVLALLCGLMNGAVNFFVMHLNTQMHASVMYPVLSAGSLILIFPYSILVCREKFSAKQYIGFIAGVVAVIFLNFKYI